MLGITDLPTYLVGLVLIILLPGPNSLYVLSVAARRGVRSGYAGAAGVWTGDAVLMTLSAAGVASLLQANESAFAVVKWVGASYLLWLAIGMMRAAWGMWRSRRTMAEQLADATAEAGLEAPAARRAALPPRAGHQPAQPQGDPVLRRLLRAVRRPGLRPPGALVPRARHPRDPGQRGVPLAC